MRALFLTVGTSTSMFWVFGVLFGTGVGTSCPIFGHPFGIQQYHMFSFISYVACGHVTTEPVSGISQGRRISAVSWMQRGVLDAAAEYVKS